MNVPSFSYPMAYELLQVQIEIFESHVKNNFTFPSWVAFQSIY